MLVREEYDPLMLVVAFLNLVGEWISYKGALATSYGKGRWRNESKHSALLCARRGEGRRSGTGRGVRSVPAEDERVVPLALWSSYSQRPMKLCTDSVMRPIKMLTTRTPVMIIVNITENRSSVDARVVAAGNQFLLFLGRKKKSRRLGCRSARRLPRPPPMIMARLPGTKQEPREINTRM